MPRGDAAWAMLATATGERLMFRKLLLPMLATAALAGCATDYQYRGGNGDYYYGQPRVEYRDLGPGGFHGGIGIGAGYGGFGYGGYGYGPTYYYDRYGRLIYGDPGRYYGSWYYGGNGRYPTHPPRGHDHQGDPDGDAANRPDRPPPWRDLGHLQPRDPYESVDGNRGERQRPVRRPLTESHSDAPMRTRPMRTQGSPAIAPAVRERSEPSSRMGGFIGDAKRGRGQSAPPVED